MNQRERTTAQMRLDRARKDIVETTAAIGRHTRRADDLRSSSRTDAAPRLARKMDELNKLNQKLAVRKEREAKYLHLLAPAG